jgi:hypothetical protein
MINIVEFASRAGDNRPGLAENPNAGGDLEGVRDQVSTCIKEDDLAACELSSVSITDQPELMLEN